LQKEKKKKRRLRTIIRWVIWVFVIQFVLINISAALYAYKFTHLYPASEATVQSPAARNIFAKTWQLFSAPRFYKQGETERPAFAYDTIHLKTKDSIPIEAWYGRWNTPDSAAKGTVILFHGLMANKSMVLQQAYEFVYWGYNVMLVDTRSHGNSAGNITTIGYRESEEVKLAYEYIKSKGEPAIFLWGFSMGAVQIIKSVAEDQLHPAGIILESPFGSLQSHIKSRVRSLGFPKQPFGFFITLWAGWQQGFNGFSFNTVNYAKKINCPVLLQCGSKDQLVTVEEATDIYTALATTNKKMIIYEGANHESFLQKDAVLWRKEVGDFLNH
jgi:alpha-beta hydrolase superfamily lysophospholipase